MKVEVKNRVLPGLMLSGYDDDDDDDDVLQHEIVQCGSLRNRSLCLIE